MICRDSIRLGSLLFHRVCAKLDGGWLLHCYVQHIVVSGVAVNEVHYCLAFDATDK